MQRLVPLATAVMLAFAAAPGSAATVVAKARPKAAVRHAQPAPAVPPAPVVDEPLAPAQLEIAARVYTGRADCEFDQHIDVSAVDGQPGHFRVAFGKAAYTMVPRETTTGAVRLEDARSGMLWIQIPAKAMLIDTKAGHRVVDACLLAEQRVTATAAAVEAGAAPATLGIAPTAPNPTTPNPIAPTPTASPEVGGGATPPAVAAEPAAAAVGR